MGQGCSSVVKCLLSEPKPGSLQSHHKGAKPKTNSIIYGGKRNVLLLIAISMIRFV